MRTTIIVAASLAYLIASFATGRIPTASGLLLLFLFVGLGAVGFVDDYIKIAKQRSLGLRSRAKMTGQVVVAVELLGSGHALSSVRTAGPMSTAAEMASPPRLLRRSRITHRGDSGGGPVVPRLATGRPSFGLPVRAGPGRHQGGKPRVQSR